MTGIFEKAYEFLSLIILSKGPVKKVPIFVEGAKQEKYLGGVGALLTSSSVVLFLKHCISLAESLMYWLQLTLTANF